MSKILVFDDIAKEKLLKGVRVLAKAVGSTYGPLGRNVALERKWSVPQVIHDGVTVAREIEIEDPFENMGVQLIKDAAAKTGEYVGDGTTTATILAEALVSEGMKRLENGINPMKLRRGMLHALEKILIHIKDSSLMVTKEGSEQIAIISAQDEEIGSKVAEAINKMGLDGVITVEEGSGNKVVVDYKEGMEFDKGFISPYFITNKEKQEAVILDPFILVTNHKITLTSDILSLLESLLLQSRDLVIICDDLEGDALANLITNKVRGTLNVLPVQAPGFGTTKDEILKDIAALVGAKFIDKNLTKLSSVTFDSLGKCSQVKSTSGSTAIIGGTGDTSERVKEIKTSIETGGSEFDIEKLKSRLARLTSGAAIIKVGAVTEAELKEKKERTIDAVSATKAALEEGTVSGGATALLKSIESLSGITDPDLIDGVEVVKISLTKPFIKLMENAGLDYLDLLPKVKQSKLNEGIDVMDGQLKDLTAAGIIDPLKVVRIALENAVSVAGSILTTNTLIADKPEEKKNDKGEK